METNDIMGISQLPNCYGQRGKAFKQYGHELGHYLYKLKDNASLFGLAIALIGAVL